MLATYINAMYNMRQTFCPSLLGMKIRLSRFYRHLLLIDFETLSNVITQGACTPTP